MPQSWPACRYIKMERNPQTTRKGFSLLELLVSVTLLVSMVTAVSVLLRVNYDTWLDYRSDNLQHESAIGVLRHIVREVRQCEEVTAISSSGDNSGSLAIQMPSGNLVVWDHNGTNVLYGITSASQLLGNHITGLNFIGYERDGVTTTTVPQDIQCVQITISYTMPGRATSARSLTSKVWVRAF